MTPAELDEQVTAMQAEVQQLADRIRLLQNEARINAQVEAVLQGAPRPRLRAVGA